jgi:hypothetical protein
VADERQLPGANDQLRPGTVRAAVGDFLGLKAAKCDNGGPISFINRLYTRFFSQNQFLPAFAQSCRPTLAREW